MIGAVTQSNTILDYFMKGKTDRTPKKSSKSNDPDEATYSITEDIHRRNRSSSSVSEQPDSPAPKRLKSSQDDGKVERNIINNKENRMPEVEDSSDGGELQI